MLEKRLFLQGNKTERIRRALRKAGWYPGRKVTVFPVLDYYNKWNIALSPQAIAFFQEYYGIASRWYIEVNHLEWGADFEFQLFPYPKGKQIL